MVACVQTTPLPQKNYDNRYLTQKDYFTDLIKAVL